MWLNPVHTLNPYTTYNNPYYIHPHPRTPTTVFSWAVERMYGYFSGAEVEPLTHRICPLPLYPSLESTVQVYISIYIYIYIYIYNIQNIQL